METKSRDQDDILFFNNMMQPDSLLHHYLTVDKIYSIKAKDYLAILHNEADLVPTLQKAKEQIEPNEWNDPAVLESLKDLIVQGPTLRSSKDSSVEGAKLYDEVMDSAHTKLKDASKHAEMPAAGATVEQMKTWETTAASVKQLLTKGRCFMSSHSGSDSFSKFLSFGHNRRAP